MSRENAPSTTPSEAMQLGDDTSTSATPHNELYDVQRSTRDSTPWERGSHYLASLPPPQDRSASLPPLRNNENPPACRPRAPVRITFQKPPYRPGPSPLKAFVPRKRKASGEGDARLSPVATVSGQSGFIKSATSPTSPNGNERHRGSDTNLLSSANGTRSWNTADMESTQARGVDEWVGDQKARINTAYELLNGRDDERVSQQSSDSRPMSPRSLAFATTLASGISNAEDPPSARTASSQGSTMAQALPDSPTSASVLHSTGGMSRIGVVTPLSPNDANREDTTQTMTGPIPSPLPTPSPSISQQSPATPLIFRVLDTRALHFHVLDHPGRTFVELAITVSPCSSS